MRLLKQKPITYVLIGIPAVLVALVLVIPYINNQNARQVIRSDLLSVAKKLELYKSDNGEYPGSEELENAFATDTRYMVPLKANEHNYARGLGMTANFFYCKQDEPSKYVLLAARDYDYALYVTNDLVIHEYSFEGVKPWERPADYPFHLHVKAAEDVCPTFLPGFSDSANGYGDRDGQVRNWARWTGIKS